MRSDYITEFKPRPAKWMAFLAFAAFSALMGALQARDGTWLIGAILIVWGGYGALVSMTALFSKRMVLRLTSEGFGFGTLRKRYFYDWQTIAGFSIGSLNIGWLSKKRVCFTFRGGYQGEEEIRAINQRWMGIDRLLPDTYGKNPAELAKLLEEWRLRYAQTQLT